MEALRKIIEATPQIVIDLPEVYHHQTIEVIVLPLDEHSKGTQSLKKYDYSKFYGKLQWDGDAVAEQRKLRDEWD